MISSRYGRPLQYSTPSISFQPSIKPFFLIYLAIWSFPYSLSNCSLIPPMLARYGYSSASSLLNVSQYLYNWDKTWVPQIRAWWRGNSLDSGLARLRPDRLVLVRKNYNQWKIWVFSAQSFSSLLELLWGKCDIVSVAALALPSK